MDLLRAKARRLLTSILSFNDVEGDPSLEKYQEVCKDYGGDGTTCGLLCHWLLWRLGVSAQNRVAPSAFRSNAKPIINRSETGFSAGIRLPSSAFASNQVRPEFLLHSQGDHR
jgi:hypothetical protein